LAAVHKTIDSRLIRPRSARSGTAVRRLLTKEQLIYLQLEVLFVEFKFARRKVESQLKQLAHIEEMVVTDPQIMRGTPVFKGTRIPVDLVADMLAQGATAEEILEGYPTLSEEKIAMSPLYMRAFPRRGRPSRRPWQGTKATGGCGR
jgi:uncharacterized protein (DUF433 family)